MSWPRSRCERHKDCGLRIHCLGLAKDGSYCEARTFPYCGRHLQQDPEHMNFFREMESLPDTHPNKIFFKAFLDAMRPKRLNPSMSDELERAAFLLAARGGTTFS
jgi:hypothetical protein